MKTASHPQGELSRAQAQRSGAPTSRGRFLRKEDVIATTGLSRATIYRMISAGNFPRQHALTSRCVGWWEADINAWLDARLEAA